jgi:hypothetical protein
MSGNLLETDLKDSFRFSSSPNYDDSCQEHNYIAVWQHFPQFCQLLITDGVDLKVGCGQFGIGERRGWHSIPCGQRGAPSQARKRSSLERATAWQQGRRDSYAA